MSRFSTLGLAVATGLLMVAPAGLAAQGTETNPDNTAYGTTSAEFLLFGAGARGTALGDAFAAVATDVSALYYNPGAAALISGPGAMVSTYDYVADTKYSYEAYLTRTRQACAHLTGDAAAQVAGGVA